MKGLKIGLSASLSRRFSAQDGALYRELVGDESAEADEHGEPLPEALIGGMFSFILGTVLPGYGTHYLKQRLVFARSTYYDEVLTATVTITRLRPEKQLVNLETRCENGAGELVCSGEALVLAADVASRES